MPRDHGARFQRLYRVERSDPIAASLRGGLGEVEVNIVIGSVASDDQAD